MDEGGPWYCCISLWLRHLLLLLWHVCFHFSAPLSEVDKLYFVTEKNYHEKFIKLQICHFFFTNLEISKML